MKSKIIAFSAIFLMLFFIVGCEKLQEEMSLGEPEEEVQAEQPAEEEETAAEPEATPEETIPAEEPEETPEETLEETIPEISETTTLTITPEKAKPLEMVTIKVIPNEEYGYKTTIKIYDENEKRIKQLYIPSCGSICKKEKSISFKTEYDWKGDYCARVVDVETNKEVGECFKVE